MCSPRNSILHIVYKIDMVCLQNIYLFNFIKNLIHLNVAQPFEMPVTFLCYYLLKYFLKGISLLLISDTKFSKFNIIIKFICAAKYNVSCTKSKNL